MPQKQTDTQTHKHKDNHTNTQRYKHTDKHTHTHKLTAIVGRAVDTESQVGISIHIQGDIDDVER